MRRDFDITQVIGAGGMVAALKRKGWTGTDIAEHVGILKEHRLKDLDGFAGGQLSRLEGTPLYAVMLEMTALRYMLGGDHGSDGDKAQVYCMHGYAQAVCNSCLRGMR